MKDTLTPKPLVIEGCRLVIVQDPPDADGIVEYDDLYARQCLATPYAIARGADCSRETETMPGMPCVCWWTSEYCFRHGGTYAYYFSPTGEVGMTSPFVRGIAVRPAICITRKPETADR